MLPQAGLDPFEVQLAYKKYGSFSFNIKPLNGARTNLSVIANTGDTIVTVDNSAISYAPVGH